MGDYPNCTFAELQLAFCKRYKKSSKWSTNLPAVEKYEAGKEWKSGSLLWEIIEVGFFNWVNQIFPCCIIMSLHNYKTKS